MSPGQPAPGHRLPSGTRPGAVALAVADLERSRIFYRDILGLVPREAGGARGLELAASADGPPLLVLREEAGASPVPRGGRLGLYHVALLVPDRATLGRFLGHIHRHAVPMAAADHLVSEALYLTDPDGLGIEVYADRPREAWGARGAEIAMDSRPLDAAGLVAAGASEPWGGMPPDTRVGHIHLQVGDLGEAAAFYHEALGLDRMVWSYPGALFLAAGGYHHHLGLNTWSRGPVAGPGDARILWWALEVPAEAVGEAREALAAAGLAVEAVEGGVAVRDPWGVETRLVHA